MYNKDPIYKEEYNNLQNRSMNNKNQYYNQQLQNHGRNQSLAQQFNDKINVLENKDMDNSFEMMDMKVGLRNIEKDFKRKIKDMVTKDECIEFGEHIEEKLI